MKKVIDMHSHILPGVDDGAASYEMSMQMLRCAANDGISTITLTPHNKPGHRHIPVSEMMFGVEKLRDMMAEEAIETGLDVGLSEQDILERLQKKLDISIQKAQEYFLRFGKQVV